MDSENKSTKRRFAGSYFISLMSIMLVLFVLGMYAFVMIYTDHLLDFVKENIGFEIVMKSNAKESAIISLKDELSKKNYVKSAEYISKKEATRIRFGSYRSASGPRSTAPSDIPTYITEMA